MWTRSLPMAKWSLLNSLLHWFPTLNGQPFAAQSANLVSSWETVVPAAIEADEECTPSPAGEEEVLIEGWGAAEIEHWIRTTLRLANRAAADALQEAKTKEKCFDAMDERATIIQNRWEVAKRHIPDYLHKELEQMLHEPPVTFERC